MLIASLPPVHRFIAAAFIVGVTVWPSQGHDGVRASAQDLRGHLLPGEYEPVERLIISWDDRLSDFLIDIIDAAQSEVDITVLLDPGTSVYELDYQLQQIGSDWDMLEVVRVPVESIWVRDFGPIVTRGPQGRRHIIDFAYAADEWGDAIPAELHRILWPQWRLRSVPIEFEGGNLQSDGHGRCITSAGYISADPVERHEEPLTSEVDLPRLRRWLRTELGCKQLFVLPPILGEPTGHVDMLAQITGPRQVIVGEYDALIDPINAGRLNRAARILRRGGFQVRRIPMPPQQIPQFSQDPEEDIEPDIVYPSYTNALALNRVVLVPVYDGDEAFRARALAVFQAAYPGRTVIPIDATGVISLYGAVHCATMTIAANTPAPAPTPAPTPVPGPAR